jgi:uncharacterized surface protein with fasciclin (FAS1) repeats
MRSKKIAVLTVASAFAFALTACSTATSPAAAPAAGAATTVTTTAPATPSGEFGSACSSVPTDPTNPGSFAAMAKVPVATAASGNPVLSTLVTAIQKANLVDSLNSASGITVFAPANSAFAKIPTADLNKVLADNTTLTKVLTYHVVGQRLSPDQLAGTHKTLEGADLTVTGSRSSFTVDGTSMVVCGNIQTANATVYIIDTVLMPPN